MLPRLLGGNTALSGIFAGEGLIVKDRAQVLSILTAGTFSIGFDATVSGDAFSLGDGLGSLAPCCELDIPGELRAFLNLPSGFVEVLSHDWPELGKASLLDVAVGDFDDNGACLADIAFGYDRVLYTTSDQSIEYGALVSLMGGEWPALSHHEFNWSSRGEREQVPVFSGKLAGGSGPGTPPLWLGAFAPSGDPTYSGLLLRWQDGEVTEQLLQQPVAEGEDSPFDGWVVPLWDMDDALVVVHGNVLSEILEVYDLNDLSRGMRAEHPLLGTNGENREFGGTAEQFQRGMLDVEGDGDVATRFPAAV
jgi:hypothetical protein